MYHGTIMYMKLYFVIKFGEISGPYVAIYKRSQQVCEKMDTRIFNSGTWNSTVMNMYKISVTILFSFLKSYFKKNHSRDDCQELLRLKIAFLGNILNNCIHFKIPSAIIMIDE